MDPLCQNPKYVHSLFICVDKIKIKYVHFLNFIYLFTDKVRSFTVGSL
jgi:hypothetical protein